MRRKPARSRLTRRPAPATMPGVDAATLREARRVFEQELPREAQFRVAEEIVITREHEFRLAYPNVALVTCGHRRVRAGRRKRHRVVPTPCVRFWVSRKWPKGQDKRTAGRIPRHLLAFCLIGDERRLCAVPTDVEDARIHQRVKAQGASIAAVWNGARKFGVLACAIERDVFPDRVYGVGCRHVLSLSADFFDETTWGADVAVQTAPAATIGPTRAIAGPLGESDSFDAQLVDATSRDALRKALSGPTPLRHVGGAAELRAAFPTYDIHTPTGRLSADFVDTLATPEYDVGSHTIRHRTLVHSQPVDGTNPGSSGSPVISKDGGTLLGMHVAGTALIDRGHFVAVSYMIPAWELLRPGNYANAGKGETWKLVAP